MLDPAYIEIAMRTLLTQYELFLFILGFGYVLFKHLFIFQHRLATSLCWRTVLVNLTTYQHWWGLFNVESQIYTRVDNVDIGPVYTCVKTVAICLFDCFHYQKLNVAIIETSLLLATSWHFSKYKNRTKTWNLDSRSIILMQICNNSFK